MSLFKLNDFADRDLLLTIKNKLINLFMHESEKGLFVNKDEINIFTINGSILLSEVPEILELYCYTFSKLNLQHENMLRHINELDIAISANILSLYSTDQFRMHFDRNQITAVIYLTNNKSLPLKIYSDVRPDPVFFGKQEFNLQNFIPDIIEPAFNSIVIFNGNRSFHGVFFEDSEKDINEDELRISLQFAFNLTKNLNFISEEYYGRR